jgi:dihydroorotate dehydrogenase
MIDPQPRPHLLPTRPDVPSEIVRQVQLDHDRFAVHGLPADLDRYLLETYRLDVTASYAGMPLRNPWGKGSGQLSLNRAQVEEAALAKLGLVVLKTVIAHDSSGHQSMSAWAIKESQMVAHPITSPLTGATGWTITWKGRGWWQTFDEYLELVRAGCEIGKASQMLVVPSVKYHLPAPGETSWRYDEYVETTRALLAAYQEPQAPGPVVMPLEKDFSPTLAGSDRASQRAMVLEWLTQVPGMIRSAAADAGLVRVGLKLFNSLDDDTFQLAMLAAVHGDCRPDFLVYANRLFDPDRVFESTRGVAYGGPDLSDRNLRLLSALRLAQSRGEIDRAPLDYSATGDVSSGKIAVEYALRGCSSFQIHTLFQLPASEYAMRVGTKVQRALHRLYFDPADGFIVWLLHAARRLQLAEPGQVRFLDLVRRGAASALTRRDLDTEPP